MANESLEKQLLDKEFAIQYTVSASFVECSICHPDWVIGNLYAARILPAGKGETMEAALIEAVRSDDGLRSQFLQIVMA